MPALMSKRPSAALSEIRRELDRRRKLAAVANGRIVKKSSAPPMIPKGAAGAIMQKMATPLIPRKPAGAAIVKPSLPRPRAPAIAYVPLEEAPRRCTAPKGRPTPFGMNAMNASGGIKKSFLPMPRKPAAATTEKSSATTISPASEPIQEGTKVCVRTPMGTTPKGLRLFIWLSAVVVSDAEDGYFGVMYDGNFPRDNPFHDVRVARDQVKKMPSSHQ